MLFLLFTACVIGTETRQEEKLESIPNEPNDREKSKGSNVATQDTDYEIDKHVTDRDFVLRLVSEEHTYSPHEKVNIKGMVKYVGEMEEIEVGHGGFSLISFNVREKNHDITINSVAPSIANSSVLTQGKWKKESFQKSGEIKETDFHQAYFNKDGLPKGSYTITATINFRLEEDKKLILSESIDIEVE